jgi:Sulfatase-modifying factor enzyme 1
MPEYLRSPAPTFGEAMALVAMLGVIGESVSWAMARGLPFEAVVERWAYILGAKPPLPPLVEIPAGSFRMGSEKENDSKPEHPVTFAQSFSLGATEVTFREWDACVADGGCDYRPADQGWGREMRPMINVSWQDAQSYVAWLSQRTGKTGCRARRNGNTPPAPAPRPSTPCRRPTAATTSKARH